MDPIDSIKDAPQVLEAVTRAALSFLAELNSLPADPADRNETADAQFSGDLPEEGRGVVETIGRLASSLEQGATRTTGRNFYAFVTGGVTPASLAADWLVSLHDQNVAGRVTSTYGTLAEQNTIRWLLKLVGLPSSWGGTFVPSASIANLSGLACALRWIAEKRQIPIESAGIAALGEVHVLATERVHPSSLKALRILGLGSDFVHVFPLRDDGGMDVDGMDALLDEFGDSCILVACAGEANSGSFDPIGDFVALADNHSCWLHVDAAFGLLGRLSPTVAPYMKGLERVHSIATDAHKWFNTPYDTGIALVKDMSLLGRVFQLGRAPYISDLSEPSLSYVNFSAEGSRRMRCLPLWAGLEAYGAHGYRNLVERHLSLARFFADALRDSGEFEVLNEVQTPIVCFRHAPVDAPEASLATINAEIVRRLSIEGRFSLGMSNFQDKPCVRAAFFNWRIDEAIVADLFRHLLHVATASTTRRQWPISPE